MIEHRTCLAFANELDYTFQRSSVKAIRQSSGGFSAGEDEMIGLILSLVFGAGCLGGLVNSLISGELQLPHRDSEAKVYRPGWLGNVVVGGIAAIVFWGLYGPLADTALIGNGTASEAAITVSELIGSMLTGIGGGRLLTAEVDKEALQKRAIAQKGAISEFIETMGATYSYDDAQKRFGK